MNNIASKSQFSPVLDWGFCNPIIIRTRVVCQNSKAQARCIPACDNVMKKHLSFLDKMPLAQLTTDTVRLFFDLHMNLANDKKVQKQSL